MSAIGIMALTIGLAACASQPALAAPTVQLYLFHARGCSACAAEESFLDGLRQRAPGLEVSAFECRDHPDNARLMVEIARAFGVEVAATPVTFIGEAGPIVGFRGDGTASLIESRVRECLEHGCEDPVAPLVEAALRAGRAVRTPLPRHAGVAPAPAAARGSGESVVDLPLVGRTDLSQLPLAALAVVLGGLDSFNPCAFFVLLTLLGVVVHARSRGKMLLIGGTFVCFSGLVYFLFMAAWLNVFLHLGALQVVTAAAGVIALAIGGINVKDFYFFKRGVSLSIPEGRKPGLFQRMRALLAAASVPATLLGTAVLALAANSYELLCTAGFPMVFTRILTLKGLTTGAYYRYLALYNVVYVLPLFAVVAVVSRSLGSRKLSQAQGRFMKLVSGLMMLGLGTVILVDPGLFNDLRLGAALLLGALLCAAALAWAEQIHRRRPASREAAAGGTRLAPRGPSAAGHRP